MTDYTQRGEGALIDAVFAGLEHGYAVDVGASDGVLLSNTKALEEQGWDVLCIEPNPYYFELLSACRKRVLPVACDSEPRDFAPFTVIVSHFGLTTDPKKSYETMMAGSSLEPRWDLFGKVGVPCVYSQQVVPVAVRTLDWCLEQSGFPRLDFLSIDTEGNELRVLQGFDLKRWAPKLVVVENWLDAQEIRDYFEGAGYSRKSRLLFNDLYVRPDA